jgi:hypothetical protein
MQEDREKDLWLEAQGNTRGAPEAIRIIVKNTLPTVPSHQGRGDKILPQESLKNQKYFPCIETPQLKDGELHFCLLNIFSHCV